MFTKMEPQRRCHLFETGKERAEAACRVGVRWGGLARQRKSKGKDSEGKLALLRNTY